MVGICYFFLVVHGLVRGSVVLYVFSLMVLNRVLRLHPRRYVGPASEALNGFRGSWVSNEGFRAHSQPSNAALDALKRFPAD